MRYLLPWTFASIKIRPGTTRFRIGSAIGFRCRCQGHDSARPAEPGKYLERQECGHGVHELKIDFGPGCRVYFGKAILRDYINATVGFEQLAKDTGTPAKSLMRMFSNRGNPRASNLFTVLASLQENSRIGLRVRPLR